MDPVTPIPQPGASPEAPGTRVVADADDPRRRADRRLRAVSSYLADHPTALLPLAAQFRGLEPVFESSIRGPSMEPAIPRRSRLQVRLLGDQPCRPGDVVFFLADDGGYMVHRVIYQRGRGAAEYLLTWGDATVAPDPPVLRARVLGTVVGVQAAAGWRPPGPLRAGPPHKRLLRSVGLVAMLAALYLSAPAASHLAVGLRRLEDQGRLVARRVRGSGPLRTLPR